MLTVSCPECGTPLVLEPASISNSQGWARCGHCQHVFDAAQSALPTLAPKGGAAHTLSEWNQGASTPPPKEAPPPQAPPTSPTHTVWDRLDLDLSTWPAVAPDTVAPLAPAPQTDTLELTEGAPEPTIDANAVAEHAVDPREPTLQTWQTGESESIDQPETESPEPSLEPTLPPEPASVPSPLSADPLYVSTDVGDSPTGTIEHAPMETTQDSPPKSTWRQPLAWLALGALTVALGLQVAVAQRNMLVARWPATQAWLQPLCQALNCTIDPLQTLSQVQITHSAVVKLDEQRFQMDLEVRNDGALTVALPMVELSLQDNQGHVWSRKVLPLHTATPLALLNARSRVAGQLFWHMAPTDAQRVDGYRLRLVY